MPSSLSLYLTECCHIFCLGATGLLLFPSRPIWFVPKLLVRQHSEERDVLFVVGANTLHTVSLTTHWSPSHLTSHIGPALCPEQHSWQGGIWRTPSFPSDLTQKATGGQGSWGACDSTMLRNGKVAEGILGHQERHSTFRNYHKCMEN